MLISCDAKTCPRCKETKVLTDFYKNKYQCKSCHKLTNNKNKSTKLNYYHRDKAINPQKYLWKQAKARAIKRNLPFDLKVSDIVLPNMCPYFQKPFIYNDKKWTYSIDRIIPELGYVVGNIEVISTLANSMKWNATHAELLQFAKGVLDRDSKEVK